MSTTDLPGSSLLAGRYRLVERLGAGGMSVVWRGFDEVLGRQVAVKVLPPSTSTDPSFRRRLRAEAQAAARLSHPHITNVYDYGEATTVDGEPVPYVVMELVDGESLAAVLARSRRLPWPAAVRISSEVAAALAAAHARGIVHRDVTPANVMLTPAGAKVVDFGISALIGENDIDPDGSLLGTPAYLAPERLEGGQVSPATDVYAVGLLIYRTLIGQLPWDVGTTTALLRAHQYTEPEPLPPVEGLPPAVEALIARCLEKRPDDRPSSAEVAHVLASVAAGNPSSRGFVPDWADSSEDTTILPSSQQYTDSLGRIRAGQARVQESEPGRGVASVRGAAVAPGQPAHVSDAPVSPAPGSAMPVSLARVQAAVDGQPVSDGASVLAGPVAMAAGQGAAPAPSALAPGNGPRGGQPSPGGGRNSRFAGAPRGGSAPAVARSQAGPAMLRPATGGRPGGDAPAAPPPNDPPPVFDRPGGGGSGRNQSRRVLLVAGAVVLLGLGAYGWSLASVNDNDVSASPEPSVVAATGKCVISYTVWSDTGKEFKASVSVANRDTTPISGWKLWFVMPGDQVLTGLDNKAAKLDQANGAVTLAAKKSLQPQATQTMAVKGRYLESNAAPKVFKLDGETCETYVSGKPGAPSQPVQQLSDGTTRLGPVPTSSIPVPGLSTKGGIVVPVPVPSKTSGPVKGGPSTVPTTPGPSISTSTSAAAADDDPGAKPPDTSASFVTKSSSTPSADPTSGEPEPPTNQPEVGEE